MNQLVFDRDTVVDLQKRDEPGRSTGDDGGRHVLPIVLRYLRIAERRKWLIIGVLAVCVVLGLLFTLLTTPLYTASATVEIQRESANIVDVRGVEPETSSVDSEFYQTQYGLLRSRSLAERVARELRLHEDPAFFDMFGDQESLEQLQGDQVAAADASGREQRVRSAASILLENIDISPVRMSSLVEVEFTSPSPELSARIVNAWTTTFIENTLERRFEATTYARNFLEERLAQVRERLERSERLLVGYADRQNIVSLPSTTASADGSVTTERPLVAEDLSALNQELNEATAERVAAESRLGTNGGVTVEGLQNQTIAALRTRRTELKADYAKLISQFEPDYPPARALADQIEQIGQSIAQEEQRVRDTLRATYAAAAERESMLKQRVDGLRADLLDLRGRTIQYNIYQRDVDTNRELYDGLLQRYKEIGVAGGVGVNNVAIVDAAQVPEEPSSPRLMLNLLLAILVGLGLGVVLALVIEHIDEAVSDPTDVEDALGLPLLGTIPSVDIDDPEAALEDPKSPLFEAYLSAQTSLGFTTDHGVPRTLVITSTRPAEGKTTTSYALARSLARTGRSVVLIDADMRSPSLHHIYNVGNKSGLSNYLAGDDNLAELMQGNMSGDITLMTAGPPPPNAAELLTSDRIDKLLQELSARFDYVLLDAPPVMGLADTPLMASKVEGVIFVIEAHATRSSLARVSVGRLKDAHGRVLGVLLTKFQSKRAHYGYGYEYGYGYGEKKPG